MAPDAGTRARKPRIDGVHVGRGGLGVVDL